MKIQNRRGVRAVRNAAATAVAVVGLILGSSGAAGAEVDDQNRIVSDGHDVTVIQKDTVIQGVPAMGGNPLSRQWFHNGRGLARITGPQASGFEGSTFQFGYQVAWSASVAGSVDVTFSAPQAQLSGVPLGNGSGGTATVTGILPQLGAGLKLTPGPGIAELVIAEDVFDGDFKEVHFANVHGIANGVIGLVQVRPFVRVVTANGDNVTTLGQVWTV